MKTISSDYNLSPSERERQNICKSARADAISFIGISKKTSGRVRGCLYKKGYSEDIVQSVVSELIDEGVINDSAFAESVLRTLQGSRAEASSQALKRLLRLGVDAKAAEKSVRKAFPDRRREFDDAFALMNLKFSAVIATIDELEPAELFQKKQKVFRFLLNRGYSREIAMSAINSVFKGAAYEEE